MNKPNKIPSGTGNNKELKVRFDSPFFFQFSHDLKLVLVFKLNNLIAAKIEKKPTINAIA